MYINKTYNLIFTTLIRIFLIVRVNSPPQHFIRFRKLEIKHQFFFFIAPNIFHNPSYPKMSSKYGLATIIIYKLDLWNSKYLKKCILD